MKLRLCNNPAISFTQAEHDSGLCVETKCGPLCGVRKPYVVQDQRDNWIQGSSLYYFASKNAATDAHEWTFCCLTSAYCPHKSDEWITLKRGLVPGAKVQAGKYGLCVFGAETAFTAVDMDGVELRSCQLSNVEEVGAVRVGVKENHWRTETVEIEEGKTAEVLIELRKDAGGKISEEPIGAKIIAEELP